jgi:hypothetical protein
MTQVGFVAGGKRGLLFPALIVGFVVAVISLGRLWLGNHEALTQVVWAEDGLFPLCVEKAGFLKCLVDPFAGYLLFLPRLLAGIVSIFPESQWALATNLLAGVIVGGIGAIVFVVFRKFGAGWVASTVAGLLPALAPIVGLEAINALGSVYMPLIFLSTIIISMPWPGLSRRPSLVILYASLLLLTALTIPLAGILMALIALQAFRRVVTPRAAIVWVVVIGLGLIAQVVTAATAAAPRAIHVSFDSFGAWADGTVDAILTYIPGLTSDDYSAFGMTTVSPSPVFSLLVILGILILGIILVFRGGDRRVAAGLLLLSGLAYGALPSLIGWANNRYFVIPALLWGVALLLWLDPWIRTRKAWLLIVIGALILLVWWPMMAASPYRATPAPRWSDEVLRVANACLQDPARMERPIFSPFWPPNWGDGLMEPSHPNVNCFVGRKWQ